jgi:hypothetical protein
MTEEGGGDQGFFDPRHRLLPHRGLSLGFISEEIWVITMDETTHPGAGYLDGLIEWIGDTDRDKMGAAIVLLSRAGPPVVEFLIAKAAEPSIPTMHQYRVLDLARRIGGHRGPAENRHLRELRRHWSPAIRRKAEELLSALKPQRKPRKVGPKKVVRGVGGASGKPAATRGSRQGKANGRRAGSVPASGKPIAPAGHRTS